LTKKKENIIPKGWKPLRIRITSIRQEHLLEILPENLRKEGFPISPFGKALFIETFCEINKHKFELLQTATKVEDKTKWENKGWNPLVWVISFSVI
jgi:hypothetical protein